MKNIFAVTSSPAHYIADAAVLCCFDERFRLATAKFLEQKQIAHPDMIVVAGGAKTLASPASDFEREFILGQIRLSIQLHKTRRVIVMIHSDCGAYGGLAVFNGDAAAESNHHAQELQRAVRLLKGTFPDLAVEPYFAKFDGICEPTS